MEEEEESGMTQSKKEEYGEHQENIKVAQKKNIKSRRKKNIKSEEEYYAFVSS